MSLLLMLLLLLMLMLILIIIPLLRVPIMEQLHHRQSEHTMRNLDGGRRQ